MSYIASQHSVTNLPLGIAQAVPTDARSYFYDTVNFKYRAYISTAEVLTYLDTSTKRTGQFPIVVNTGGTLLNGVITGGTNQLFYFRDGTSNTNLIPLNKDYIVNVKDLGAKGDGVTDDINAFESGVILARGNILFIPSGKYILSRALVISPDYPIIIQGVGVNVYNDTAHKGSVLSWTTNVYGIACINENNTVEGLHQIEIKDVALFGNNTASFGVSMEFIHNMHLTNVWVSGFLNDGINIKDCWGVKLHKVTATHNRLNGLHMVRRNNNVTVSQSAFNGNGLISDYHNVFITGDVGLENLGITFQGCDFSYVGATGTTNNFNIVVVHTWGLIMTGCYSEGEKPLAYFGNNTQNLKVEGNYWQGNTVTFDTVKNSTFVGNTYQKVTGSINDYLIGIQDGIDGNRVYGNFNKEYPTLSYSGSNELNIKGFGVNNDGVTDNRARIQAAIDYLYNSGGGVLFFPKGVYVCSGNLVVRTGVILRGEGCNFLPYFTGGDVTQNKIGTTLLIAGTVGTSSVIVNGHNSGLEFISVYQSNNAAALAVVEIQNGTLKPYLKNVEIGCTTVTTAAGLLLQGSVLYGIYENVQVTITGIGQSYEASVRIGLHIESIGDGERPNANAFSGGDFQGKYKSLLIESTGGTTEKVQGIQFLGTTFEGTYNTGMEHEYLANENEINGHKTGQAYCFKWISVVAAQAVNFSGCYFECSGYTSTYNNGTNGVHNLYPVIELGTATSFVDLSCFVPISRILDRGYFNRTDDAIRFGDVNGISLIRGIPEGSNSTLQFFPSQFQSIGNIPTLKLAPNKIEISGDIDITLPVDGDPATDYYLTYHPSTNRVSKVTRVGMIPTFQEITDKAGSSNVAITDDSIIAKNITSNQGQLEVIKTGGGKFYISDENNSALFETIPVGIATQLKLSVNEIDVYLVDGLGQYTFLGVAKAVTPAPGTNNTEIATTAFVQNAISSSSAGLPDQTGNTGKFLTTDGSDIAWNDVPSGSIGIWYDNGVGGTLSGDGSDDTNSLRVADESIKLIHLNGEVTSLLGGGQTQTNVAYVDVTYGNNSSGQINNINKPFSTIDAATTALPSTGGTIMVSNGTYASPTVFKNNIVIVGAGKPTTNSVIGVTSYGVVTRTNPTHLVGGTIFQGTFSIPYDITNYQLFDLGVDCGDDFVNANFGGTAQEGLLFASHYDGSHYDQTTQVPRQNVVIQNVTVLCKMGGLVHCCIVENAFNPTVDNIDTYGGFAGFVAKTIGGVFTGIHCNGHSTFGIILKNNNYSHGYGMTLDGFEISRIGSYAAGLYLHDESSAGSLAGINVNNGTIRDCPWDINFSGVITGVISNILAMNIATSGMTSLPAGIVLGAYKVI